MGFRPARVRDLVSRLLTTSPARWMLAKAARHAFPRPTPRPVCFRGCLYAEQRPRRTTPSFSRSATTSVIQPASVDDTNLIAFFDYPQAPQKVTSPTGIFGHRILTTPAAFNALADSTLRRAHLLTERILRARESRDELFKVVKNLDRLSDMLCGIIDLAELLRNAHPDPMWVQSADEVYEKLCEFMNVLNTNVGLYDVGKPCIYLPSSELNLSPHRCWVPFCLTKRL